MPFITLFDAKSLCIRFNTIDGLIRVYDGTICLVLFGSEKYDFIYNRIRCFIGVKSCITYVISHNYAKFKVDSYDPLSLEKTVTFHNVVILIKSNKDKDKIKIKTTTTTKDNTIIRNILCYKLHMN